MTYKPKTIEDFIELLLDNNILKLGGETPSNILDLNSTRIKMTMLYNSKDEKDIIQDLNSIYNEVQIKSIIFGESNRDKNIKGKILDVDIDGNPLPFTNGLIKLNEINNYNIKDCLVIDINEINLLNVKMLPLLLIDKNTSVVVYNTTTKIENDEIYKLGYITIN